MKRYIPTLFLVLAAFTFAACGEEQKVLETENVEKDIQKIASENGVETKAECPEEVEDANEGKTYECTITYAGNENNQQTVQMKIGTNDESEFVDQRLANDEGTIRTIVAQTDAEPAKICENVTEEILEQLGGEDCPAEAEANADEEPAVIESVTVEGDTATVVSDKSTSTLERAEGGGWVITAVE